MNAILWRRCLGGLGLAMSTLGVGVGQAQQTSPKPAKDILGTWRFEIGPQEANPGFARLLDHTQTFRPDGVWWETIRRSFDADTLSCTTKWRYRLVNDTVLAWLWSQDAQAKPLVTSQILTAKDTVRFAGYSPKPVLRDQQLALAWYQNDIYSRKALEKTPAPDHIVSRSVKPVPSKVASLVGTWERVPGKGSDSVELGWVRSTFAVWPDRRYVASTAWKDGTDTFHCTEEAQWEEPTIAGDTLLLRNGQMTGRYLLQGEELLLFSASLNGNLDGPPPYTLQRVYKRVNRVPKP